MPQTPTATPDPDAPPEKLPFFPKRKKFLIPIIILLAVTLVGSVAGLLIAFTATKRSEPFKIVLAELEHHDEVKQHVGLPLETGLWVVGGVDEKNREADIMFTIRGPAGKAAVRCRVEVIDRQWEVTYLELGVGGRKNGRIITLIGDPDNPPG